MKKIKNSVFFLATLLLFTACQKELEFTNPGGGTTNPVVDFKVRTYTEAYTSTSGSFSETFNLTYDASNRIVSMIDAADPTTKFVYTYNSNNNYSMEIFHSGMLNIHEDFFLNSIPLIDSTSQYNDTGDTTLEKSVYDAANHLIQLKDYDYTTATGPELYSTTNFTYNAGGNVTLEDDGSTTYSYEYYTDLNTLNVGLIYQTTNHNQVKKTTINDGSSSVIIDHTYTYDSSNRITSETQHYSSGETVVKTYTY